MFAGLLFAVQASVTSPTRICTKPDPHAVPDCKCLGTWCRMRSKRDDIACTLVAWNYRFNRLIRPRAEGYRDVCVAYPSVDDPHQSFPRSQFGWVGCAHVDDAWVVALMSV